MLGFAAIKFAFVCSVAVLAVTKAECNAPLPTNGNISDFRFRGIDGRGNPRLVQEPNRNNYFVAVVNVQDSQCGDEGYTFELTWNSDGYGGPGSGGIFPDRPTTQGHLPRQEAASSMAVLYRT